MRVINNESSEVTNVQPDPVQIQYEQNMESHRTNLDAQYGLYIVNYFVIVCPFVREAIDYRKW